MSNASPAIFHIRRPKKRGSGTETFCGAAATEHDIRASWAAFPAGRYEPCQACIEARRQLKRRIKSKEATHA